MRVLLPASNVTLLPALSVTLPLLLFSCGTNGLVLFVLVIEAVAAVVAMVFYRGLASGLLADNTCVAYGGFRAGLCSADLQWHDKAL